MTPYRGPASESDSDSGSGWGFVAVGSRILGSSLKSQLNGKRKYRKYEENTEAGKR